MHSPGGAGQLISAPPGSSGRLALAAWQAGAGAGRRGVTHTWERCCGVSCGRLGSRKMRPSANSIT
jgi:hypothetical protein